MHFKHWHQKLSSHYFYSLFWWKRQSHEKFFWILGNLKWKLIVYTHRLLIKVEFQSFIRKFNRDNITLHYFFRIYFMALKFVIEKVNHINFICVFFTILISVQTFRSNTNFKWVFAVKLFYFEMYSLIFQWLITLNKSWMFSRLNSHQIFWNNKGFITILNF